MLLDAEKFDGCACSREEVTAVGVLPDQAGSAMKLSNRPKHGTNWAAYLDILIPFIMFILDDKNHEMDAP